jgi:branched-chain amino acid transport system permease protein
MHLARREQGLKLFKSWEDLFEWFHILVEPYLISAAIYGSLFGLMAVGLTLTYLTTRVPNFAYGSFVTIGIYNAFSLFRVQGLNPYLSTPLSFLVGGVASVIMYRLVLKPLGKRGSSLVSLMIATFAVDIVFLGLFGIYSDYLTARYGISDSKQFYQVRSDFSINGLPGILVMAPALLALTTVSLYLLLTKTNFGVAMRASVENPSLARILGIDVEKVYLASWFLGGGFAASAGSFYVLWLPGGIDTGSGIIVEIFAASILGGLTSVYGAVLGGLIVGGSEIIITSLGAEFFGSWVAIYQKAIPLMLMVITLLILPKGIVSINWRKVARLGRRR